MNSAIQLSSPMSEVLVRSASGNSPSSSASALSEQKFTTTKEVEYTAAVIGGCLLSMNAGYINAITLIETGNAVSHMSGHVTNMATALDRHEWNSLAVHAAIIGAFTFGSFLTGLLGGNYDNFKLGHSYGRIFTAGFVILVIAFAADISKDNKLVYVTFLSMACGLQNAMTTKFSGNMIRTTHVTGSLTDIGLYLGRAFRGRREHLWKLGILVPMTVSFFVGSVLGSILLNVLRESCIIVNIVLFGLTALLYTVYFSKYFKVRFWEAVFGNIEFAVAREISKADELEAFEKKQVYEQVVTYRARRTEGAPESRGSSILDIYNEV